MKLQVNTVFPDWMIGQGIFKALSSKNVPWKDSVDSVSLDLDFHGNYAGDKRLSPLVYKLSQNGPLSQTAIDQLAELIVSLYGRNWIKLWDTLTFEYDPIENYSMVETMDKQESINYGKEVTDTGNITNDKTGGETHKIDSEGKETINDNGTVKTENEQTVTGETTKTESRENETAIVNENTLANNVYAFNSSESVPTGGNVQNGTDTSTETGSIVDSEKVDNTNNLNGTVTTDLTHTISDSNNQTDGITYDIHDAQSSSNKVTEGGIDITEEDYTLKRSGNIGVTTSQQMIEQERNLWVWNYFRDTVYPNISSVLALSVY